MERELRDLPESPARRAGRIARVGARYGFGFVFRSRLLPGRRREEPGRVGTRLRFSLEELGPTFAELGRFLSIRRDLIPPDVAAELGRTRVVAKPIGFAEARARIERELGNTLERLFIEFEEVPVRVGPFTQSHQAVLPGGRPALVVVNRTGVRRDLLAMRPVADLTRRRLGDRLPLDPSAIVAEFSAHVTQRRDMYYSAQISRRLRELEDFPLLVPDVYRDYSTGRCVTSRRRRTPGPWRNSTTAGLGSARAARAHGRSYPRRPGTGAFRPRLPRGRTLARRPDGGVRAGPGEAAGGGRDPRRGATRGR